MISDKSRMFKLSIRFPPYFGQRSCADSIYLKVIGIRPMAPVLNTGLPDLKVSEHEMLRFSVRKEIIKNDNSLPVILLSKVVGNEFLQTL